MTNDASGAGHTPTPWEAGYYSSIVGLPIMAQPDKTKNSVVVVGVRGERAIAEANAAFIVHACNNYEAVVKQRDAAEAANFTLVNMLKWSCKNEGECLADHPELLEKARDLLASLASAKSTEPSKEG